MRLPVQPPQYSRNLEQHRSGEVEREVQRIYAEIKRLEADLTNLSAGITPDMTAAIAAHDAEAGAHDTAFDAHEAAADPHSAASYTQSTAAESISQQWKFGSGIVLPKTSGVGIKVDTSAETFGWRDIIGTPQEPVSGTGKPTWTQIASSGVYTWNYITSDVQYYTWHIPHDYVPGSDIHFHVHWFGSQTAGNYTKWTFSYLYSKGHAQTAFPTTVTSVSVEQQQSTTAYTHMIAETAGVTISGLEVDGLILCKVTRSTPAGTDVSGGVFVPCVDLHYQSTNMATKQKSPDFYT